MKWPSSSVLREHALEWLRYGALGIGVYILVSQWVHHSSGPKEGTHAAAFDLPLLGEPGRVSLAAQHGKPVLMEVFASWCSACKRTSPRLVDLWREHQRDDVTFLAVSVDEDPAAASQIKSSWHIPFEVALDDGTISRNYAISMLPTLIYIDKDGTVRHASAGITSRSEMEDWLATR
ncbi:MAG TPA: TlpA disulfide reductase family protein [Polyangiaceae bacterium]|nr:TlpA disulfide reductase family protein [Polyangiaceae bacterium]